MSWTKDEILKLNELKFLQNELAFLPVDLIDESKEEIQEMLLLEAELIVLNKNVVGYVNTKPIGIYSFQEAVKLEEKYIGQGKIFTYHPVNVNSFKDLHKNTF
jgi:hypothetical protein